MCIFVALFLASVCSTGLSQQQWELQAITLGMLQRPTEPVTIKKGSSGVNLRVPASYWIDKYKQDKQLLESNVVSSECDSKCSGFASGSPVGGLPPSGGSFGSGAGGFAGSSFVSTTTSSIQTGGLAGGSLVSTTPASGGFGGGSSEGGNYWSGAAPAAPANFGGNLPTSGSFQGGFPSQFESFPGVPPSIREPLTFVIDDIDDDEESRHVRSVESPKPRGIPNFSSLQVLPRRASFNAFVPLHRKLAGELVTMLLNKKKTKSFLSLASYIRDRINPGLFIHGFSTAVLHRPDFASVKLPKLAETFPDKFVDGSIFVSAREEAFHQSKVKTPLEIPVDYTASHLEPEHRLSYFREDLSVNMHHWHWHLMYPSTGKRQVVNKDRRGELFYYMHQQIIARYDFERMCNKMPRVKRLQNFNEPIEEAYFPKLHSQVASKNWAGRPSGTILRDVNREFESEQIKFDIAELQRFRDRIYDAIHRGRVELPNGTTMALTERDGIDVLGNIIEPSDLSPNPQLYGSVHGLLHVAASVVHDPDNRHLESFSVLGDLATAMRDPLFYRIHAMINEIFIAHKKTLPPYTKDQLDFTGVHVTGVEVDTAGSTYPNVIETFWQKGNIDINRGMDFNPRGEGKEVYAKYTHLNHEDFQFRITAFNSGAGRKALVRLFLAPKFDEKGKPWLFDDQRHLFVELDKFTVDLRPGENLISRESRLSSVTIPTTLSFRELEEGIPESNSSKFIDFCGCGWPQHMLIPKGIPEGFPSVVFAMISDYETDWNPQAANRKPGPCFNTLSYCGIRDQFYPDRRAMGYPFDRQPRKMVKTTDTFMTPNMVMSDVYIRFTDRVHDPFPNPHQRGNLPSLK